MTSSVPSEITVGTETQRGFINDNVYHSAEYGEIHYSSYIPESYDGTKPYALFITLPGYEGLYFQGVGANMVENFGVEAIKYNSEMIVLSTQLNDWGEASANQAIALTEYFINHYNIDKRKVYLTDFFEGLIMSLSLYFLKFQPSMSNPSRIFVMSVFSSESVSPLAFRKFLMTSFARSAVRRSAAVTTKSSAYLTRFTLFLNISFCVR